MFNHDHEGSEMQDNRFIAVARPHPAEGIGRALQVAYRDGLELPSEFRSCLDQLDQTRL